jgi:transcriptional regulator with XRE-family HTH domain
VNKPIKPKFKPQLTLEQTRKLRLMSVRKLSLTSGVAASTISGIEGGAVPRLETIGKLSEVLGVSPEDIIWPGDPLGLDDLDLTNPDSN